MAPLQVKLSYAIAALSLKEMATPSRAQVYMTATAPAFDATGKEPEPLQ